MVSKNIKDNLTYKGKVSIKSGISNNTSGARIFYNNGTKTLFSIIYDFLMNPVYASKVDIDLIPTSLILAKKETVSLNTILTPIVTTKINAVAIDKISEEDTNEFLRYSFIINSYNINLQNLETSELNAFTGVAILANNSTQLNNLNGADSNYLAIVDIPGPEEEPIQLPSNVSDILYFTWDLDFTNQATAPPPTTPEE